MADDREKNSKPQTAFGVEDDKTSSSQDPESLLESTQDDTASESEKSSVVSEIKQTQSKRAVSKKKIAIVTAVVVVIIGIVASWFLIDQYNKAVWEQEHKQYPVRLTIVAENYNPDTSTPIPVQISGTDFEGNEVFIETLVGSVDSKQITLMRGNYTLSASASPFLEDGSMYNVSSSRMDFEVVGDSGSGESQDMASINMSPLGVEAMTEDLIQTSSDKLVSLGYDQEVLAKYSDAAKVKIQEYQATQEAVAQAAAEAKAKAKRHISTDWYEFDIPDYWVGKVEYRTNNGTTEVYPKGYPDYPLIRVELISSNAEINDGDIGDGVLGRKVNGKGGVELWRSNWPWKAAYSCATGNEVIAISNKTTRTSLYDTLIQLYTGGALTYDQVIANPDNYLNNESTTYDSFIESTIVPTLTVKNNPPA